MKKRWEQRGTEVRTSLVLSAAGLTFAFLVLIGAGIGYLLDRHFKTTWLIALFAGLGTIAGFRELLRAVALVDRAEKEAKEQQRADAAGGSGDE